MSLTKVSDIISSISFLSSLSGIDAWFLIDRAVWVSVLRVISLSRYALMESFSNFFISFSERVGISSWGNIRRLSRLNFFITII